MYRSIDRELGSDPSSLFVVLDTSHRWHQLLCSYWNKRQIHIIISVWLTTPDD